jgi:aryl-alcohol dehydrogenase-like predicted oxidoreductase
MNEKTKFTGDDLRKVDPKYQCERYRHSLKAVADLDVFAQTHNGKRVMDLAVRSSLDQPGVTIALRGACRPEQLENVGNINGWKLDRMRARKLRA